MNTEKIILESLIYSEDFVRQVLPHLKEEYFTTQTTKTIFRTILNHVEKYNKLPTRKTLYIDLEKGSWEEQQFAALTDYLRSMGKVENRTIEWLVDNTEQFCQDRAVYNAIMDSISIIEGEDKKRDKGSIPEMLQNALSVTFDTSIGHDFLESAEQRYNYYHEELERVPFDLEYFNKVTRGGVPKGTLNVIMGGTGVGKSLIMCHMASANLLEGKNVLYITLELDENQVSERIDANLLNVDIDQLKELSKDQYTQKVNGLKKSTVGKLIVKQYPTASASVAHFRHLLHELRLKKDFVPDIIYVDYINLMLSERLRGNQATGMYHLIKSIAEELRGFAMINDIPVFTATQLNREGFTSSDPGLDNTAESFGLPQTADWMFVAVQTEELEQLNQYLIVQLKTRYNDIAFCRRFAIGVNKRRMKLYDVDQSAQEEIQDEVPVFDKSAMSSYAELVGDG